MTNRYLLTACLGSLLLTVGIARAQDTTLGLIYRGPEAFEGYTLFDPLHWPMIYLIDNNGEAVHYWETDYVPGNTTYLLETGNLLRSASLPEPPEPFVIGGAGGLLQEITWNGEVVWEYVFASDTAMQHHDIEPLPNGNVLMVAWEYKTGEEAILAGRDPGLLTDGELYPDMVLELRPIPPDSAEIVWEWHIWDHLIQDYDPDRANFGVISDHPELMDFNYTALQETAEPGQGDWNHVNAIDFNPALNQIALSLRSQSEIIVIDHSTTTEEAAGSTGGRWGKGGDILYRWGNPQSYGMGDAESRKLYFQHDINWIEDGRDGQGNLLVFNNGQSRPSLQYSSVEEIRPPLLDNGEYYRAEGMPFGPAETDWTYYGRQPGDFYSAYISGARRLPNGNTLICSGVVGDLFEVTSENEIVWHYVSPVDDEGPQPQGSELLLNQMFRADRYAPDYQGLLGRDLTPMGPIELYEQIEAPQPASPKSFELAAHPNPFNAETTITLSLEREAQIELMIYDVLGREVSRIPRQDYAAGKQTVHFSAGELASGTYFIRAQSDRLETALTRVVLLR